MQCDPGSFKIHFVLMKLMENGKLATWKDQSTFNVNYIDDINSQDYKYAATVILVTLFFLIIGDFAAQSSYKTTPSVQLIINTKTWCCHQMETFSALLVLCAGNSPVTGKFPSQRPFNRPWIHDWVNNREAGDLRRHRPHYDVIVMFNYFPHLVLYLISWCIGPCCKQTRLFMYMPLTIKVKCFGKSTRWWSIP